MAEVLAMDLGGTKLLLARVAQNGSLIQKNKVPVHLDDGPDGLLKQIIAAAKSMITSETKAVALSSAGPLDPIKGDWLNPTNLKTNGQLWGHIPVVGPLQKALDLPCYLDNDAACAAMAEAWVGQGKACNNFIAITLGTGVGVGVWVNGHLLRSGRYLHTELGHMIIDSGVGAALCGCGNRGCAEAYLSGTNFAKRVSQKLGEEIDGVELLKRARSGDASILSSFEDYSYRLALFIRNLVVSYYPEKIILSGGFSAASDLFIDRTHTHLTQRMNERCEEEYTPEIHHSGIQNDMGVLGAAYLAYEKIKDI